MDPHADENTREFPSDANGPPRTVALEHFVPGADAISAADAFHQTIRKRRSVRHFSNRPVPRELIETIITAAGTAPSGANKQPWHFVAVDEAEIKREIRIAAEIEEKEFYEHRASERWLRDLAPLGTDWRKPFLEVAPWLVVIFKKVRDDDGGQMYYIDESVGLAAGFFLAAAHFAGLATLTHTPSPMKFLSRILNRPQNERPFLLIPVGYPADNCEVPDIQRKPLSQIMSHNRNPKRG